MEKNKSNNFEDKSNKQIEEMAKEMCNATQKTNQSCNSICFPRGMCAHCKVMAEHLYNAGYRKSTEVAEEIFGEIEKQLAMYSHLHRYADEARQITEEYADGTPCEMSSVWDALVLHKNGWDDYETMCKLQDNIANIEKSRLLKEFEGDIAELKKKYTEEKNDG